jgi:hypothetical protein
VDRRLKEMTELGPDYYENDAVDGFKFAIHRLRENAYYGHYAQLMADWLEKHLTQEVTSERSKDK